MPLLKLEEPSPIFRLPAGSSLYLYEISVSQVILPATCALFPQQDRAEFQKMALKNMGRQALGNQTRKRSSTATFTQVIGTMTLEANALDNPDADSLSQLSSEGRTTRILNYWKKQRRAFILRIYLQYTKRIHSFIKSRHKLLFHN